MKIMTAVWTAAATAATAAAGGIATDPDSRWYRRLRKPHWQPPAIAFPVVWTALYADLAVSSAVALDSDQAGDTPGASTGRRELAAYRGARPPTSYSTRHGAGFSGVPAGRGWPRRSAPC